MVDGYSVIGRRLLVGCGVHSESPVEHKSCLRVLSFLKSRGNGTWLYDSRATGRTNEDAQDMAWLARATGVCDAGALLEKGTPVQGMDL